MILKELADLARREGLVDDPDYEPKPVRWVVNLGRGGKFLGVTEPVGPPDAKGKVRPMVFQVPRSPGRQSNSLAFFLVDKPEYVLGFDPDDNPRKLSKLAKHRALFREYVEAGLTLTPGEAGLTALLDFLRDDEAVGTAIGEIRGPAAANDLIAFSYSDGDESGMVHDRDAVRAAWKALRHPSDPADVGLVECLICGKETMPVALHPQVKRVPGGSTSGIALVSANAAAFESLGLSGNESSPVCRPCADAYGTALNRLFHPQYSHHNGDTLPRRTFRLSDDTAVIYWASGAAEHKFEDEFGELDFADAAKAGALYEAVHAGKDGLMKNPAHFFALIVTGGQGRATLRGYYQSKIGEVAGHLRQYFADIEIVRRFENSPKYPALSWLVRSLAAQGKFENVDPDLAGRLFLAILDGKPFPAAVLARAVARIRSEREDPNRGQTKHSRERLALIRAVLNQQFRGGGPRITSLISKEVPVMLDPDCTNNAYCLGRLFAVLDNLHRVAIGSKSTIVDRYYGAASATPAFVFGALLRKARHHLAKMKGPSFEKQIREIFNLMEHESAFPTTLNLEEQGLFALGFYHQKAAPRADTDREVAATAGIGVDAATE